MTIRLHLPRTRVLGVLVDLPERLEVAVEATPATIRCQACGFKTRTVHQTVRQPVRDVACGDRPTTLVWHRRRFLCRRCGATTTETLAGVDGHMTLRLRRHLLAEVADSTVNAVARRHHLGWHAVMAVVTAAAVLIGARRRRCRVRVLCIDEKSLRKGRGGFSTIVTDGDTGAVVAVLPGRNSGVVAEFLAAQGASWRRGVEIVITDMAVCFKAPIARWLPGAVHVVDRFHVVRNLLHPLGDIRRAAQRTPHGQPHDKALFQNRYTLLTRADRLTAEQISELTSLFEDHPQLAAAWELTQRLHRLYLADDFDSAMAALAEFSDAWTRLERPAPFAPGVRTLARWADHVFAYHYTGRRTTSTAEGVNNKIEVLERKAYGFRATANHHARILIECAGHPGRPHPLRNDT